MNLVADRRRPLQATDRHEPERKRVCRHLESVPQEEISTCHPPSKYTMDYWNMEQDWKEKDSTELFSPPIMKKKPNSMIFPDNETRTAARPCPRCIAGEPTSWLFGPVALADTTDIGAKAMEEIAGGPNLL